jgi:DUF177 domain-containing protein
MLINLSDILKKKELKKNIHIQFKKDEFFDRNEYIGFSKPVTLSGCFTRNDDIIEFQGNLKTELILNCSRCLEKFNYGIDIPLNVSFSLKDELSNEHIFIDSEEIDFDPIVESYLIFELPIKKLCSEDCKGLCPYCGINLNNSKCNCIETLSLDLEEDEEIDPRFSKLKDLFKDN